MTPLNRRALSSPALVIFAALAAFTRRAADAQVSYPYLGCYNDAKERAMKNQQQVSPLTLEDCAAVCLRDTNPAWNYAGLQFGQECYCGNSYDKHGVADEGGCTMTTTDGAEAGGRWTMSIYDLTGAAASSSEYSALPLYTAQASSKSSSLLTSSLLGEDVPDAGGDTVATATQGPVESGKRAFTVVNECSQTIRVGATGGRITFGTDTDPSSKDLCDAWGASAAYNSGPMGIGCYWTLPAEEGGNTDRYLEPGQSFRYPFHETPSPVRWSGTIWGSTGCDKIDGCATGVCYSPSTDHVCPSYVGPGGPTTKAEFTLGDADKDYYDISAIDGVNLPMMIEPDNPVYPEDTSLATILKYQCGSPGAITSATGLGGCSWSYEDRISSLSESLSQYLRLVLPDSYEEHTMCETDADCGGYTCGVHPQRWADGSYKGGVLQGACGEHVAWVSAGGACAGGWTTGEFPDAFPFYCGEEVKDGQRHNMYGCSGGALAHSGYTPGADSTACGCPDWEASLIDAPSISTCNGINLEWVEKAQPWAQQLKKACPTVYTFPYDDQSSTFSCADRDDLGAEDFVNTQSYTITFCPGNSEEAMFG